MANNLPESIRSALAERKPAAVEALPDDIELTESEDDGETEPSELEFEKGIFEVYPRLYWVASILTALVVAIILWTVSLVALGYLSTDQVVRLSIPIEVFRAGSETGDLGYIVYGYFMISLTAGGAVSSFIWYHLSAPSVVRENLRVTQSLIYTLVTGIIAYSLATIVGPVLYLAVLLAALAGLIVALVGVFLPLLIVPYGLYKSNRSIIAYGVATFVGSILIAVSVTYWPGNPHWIQESPLLASAYGCSILFSTIAPVIGVYIELPLSEWGEREFLQRYMSNRCEQLVGEGAAQSGDSGGDRLLARITGESADRAEFTTATGLLDDVELAAEGVEEVEQAVDANNYEAATQQLSKVEPLVESVSPVELNETVFIDGSQAVDSIRQYSSELRSRYDQVQQQIEIERDRKSTVDDELQAIENRLDEVDELVQANRFEKSRKLLEQLKHDIHEIDGKLRKLGTQFEDVTDRLPEVRDRHESLVSKRNHIAQQHETAVEQIESAESDLSSVESLIQHGSLDEAEETVSSVQSQITSTTTTVDSYQFTELRDRLEQVSEECDATIDEIEQHQLERVQELRNTAQDQIEEAADSSVTDEETIALCERAQDRLEAAEDIATRYDHEETGAITDQIGDVQRTGTDAKIRVLGTEVAGVSVPDPASESVTGDEFQATISEIESLLQRVREMDTTRGEDLSLIGQEATEKLENVRLAREQHRARTAVRQLRNDAHTKSRKSFETAAENLRQLVDDDDERTSDGYTQMESLADRCEQNARVARRAGLGLTDESELVEIGDGAEFVPAENTDDAQQGHSNTAPSVRNNTGHESPPGQIEYDDFDRGEKIGSGGNADVYKTTLAHRETDQPIAVKEPRMQGTVTAQVIDRFAAEAETWSKLDSHEHILSVLGYGSSPIPWIALEYMNQGDLSNVQSQLNQDQQIRVATQVADGVWHAHQRGIAHLDLKPQNILVESTDGETQPTAKVTDWGLSKMLLDNSASIEGLSPQYSAPEQFDSDTFGKPDNQTDIFQLGTVFYELFTGQHPFQGSTTQAMHGILNESPAPPSDHSPDLPDGTDEILLKAISKDKSDRYEAVVNLRDDLNSLN